MENNTFKGSIFGGFNRQDVMNYIEKASKESAALLEENAERIRALEVELQELQAQHSKLQNAFNDTSAALEETAAKLSSAENMCADLKTSLDASQAENAEKESALSDARATIEALQPEVDEYHKLKNNIAEVEVEAKHRADTIIADATAKAQKIEEAASSESAALLSEAKAKAEKTISDANLSAASTRQKADQHAMLTRQQLNVLLASCKNQYDALMENYKASALQAATSIQKAQENMAQLPSVFDKINAGLTKLSESNQKKD